MVSFAAFVMAGWCDGPPPYQTTFNRDEILKLKRSNVIILSFYVENTLYTGIGDAGSYEKETLANELTNLLGKQAFYEFISVFDKKFKIVGGKNYNEVSKEITPSQRVEIVKTLKEQGADYGFIVNNQFGWEWGFLKTGVTNYAFRTYIVVVDKQGHPIWQFDAKSWFRSPIGFNKDDLIKFITGVFAKAPTVEVIKRDFKGSFYQFSELLISLITEDMQKRLHINRSFESDDSKGQIFTVNFNDNYLGNLHFSSRPPWR